MLNSTPRSWHSFAKASTSSARMWRASGRGCTVMPWAPASRQARAARTTSGALPPRELRSTATLLTLTLRTVIGASLARHPSKQGRKQARRRFRQAHRPQRLRPVGADPRGAGQVGFEQLLKAGGHAAVAEQHADLEVEAEAARVEVGAAHQRDLVVHEQCLGVEHARAVFVDAHAGIE